MDGLLRVAQKLDREIKSNYTLEIKAKDRGEPSKSSRTKFFIRLLDENDNNPIFDSKSYSASVPENISVGATVLQVRTFHTFQLSWGNDNMSNSFVTENNCFRATFLSFANLAFPFSLKKILAAKFIANVSFLLVEKIKIEATSLRELFGATDFT